MRATILFLLLTFFSADLYSQNFSWAQSWGADSYDRAGAVTTDVNGNVYTTGTFRGTMDFDASTLVVNMTSTEEDIFITKTDKHGKLIWARQFSGPQAEGAVDIKVSAAGDVYVTGNFFGTVDFDPGAGTFTLDGANGRCFICKLNAAGNFVWAKQFSGTAYTSAITLDNDNNVYSAGQFSGSSDFDPGTGEAILTGEMVSMFITKLDDDGNYIWARHFANAVSDTLLASIQDIQVDGDGNVYTTGAFQDTIDFDPGAGVHELFPKETDGFISKLDISGNFVWVKQVGGVLFDRGLALALDADANIYMLGSFAGTVDYDPGPGSATWTSGMYNSSYHTVNLHLNKYDTDGNFLWAKGMVGDGDIIGTGLELGSNGDIYTGGYYARVIDLDPGTGQHLINSTGPQNYAEDIFAAKYDNSGNFVWATTLGNSNHDRMQDLAVDADDNWYMLGNFEKTVDFNPGPGVWELTESNPSSETYDVFLAKFSDCMPTTDSETIVADCNTGFTWEVNDEVYQTSGIYHYVLANSEGCDSIITLDLDIPVLEVEIENIDGTLTYTNPQPDDTYQWVNCTLNQIVTGATESAFTPLQTASYSLIVTHGDCLDTSDCMPFTFVGLDEMESVNLHLYPNPVQDEFTIATDNYNQLLAVEVIALNGQLILSTQNPASTFSVQGWEAGIYLVKVVSAKESHVFRVVKN